MSACTLKLGAKIACIAPDAELYFHAMSDSILQMHYANPWLQMSPRFTEQFRVFLQRSSWGRKIVVELDRRGALSSPDYTTLTGEQLAAFGVPLCK